MIVTVSMKNDEERFVVHEWWTTGPSFAVEAFRDQLRAASAIWPELAKYGIGIVGGAPVAPPCNHSPSTPLSP